MKNLPWRTALGLVLFCSLSAYASANTIVAGPYSTANGLAAYTSDTGGTVYHDPNSSEEGECVWFCRAVRPDTLPSTSPDGYARSMWGNASGWHRGQVAKRGAVMCFAAGSHYGAYGHMAIVSATNGDGSVDVWESNFYPAFQHEVTKRHITDYSDLQGYLYAASSDTPPILQDTAPPSISWGGSPTGRWYNDLNLQVATWSLSDGGSGVRGQGQAWDADPGSQQYTTSSGYLVLGYLPSGQQEGQHTAHVRAWDNAGNSSDNTIGWYGCDLTPPSVSITAGPPAAVWQRTSQRVSWHVSDNLSGVRGFGQAWDADPGFQYNATDGYLDMPEGSHTLHVHAWDNTDNARGDGGNNADVTFGPYLLDTVPPAISNPSGPATSEWVGSAQAVTWSASDATSGVASSSLTWDDWTTTAVPPEGKHSGNITVTDNAGNQATLAVGPYWTDLTAPTVTETLYPAEPDGDNGWYRAAPTVAVTADDGAGSGVASVSLSIDGEDRPYSAPVTLPEGTHTIIATATDNVGHVESGTSEAVMVDSVPPVVTGMNTAAVSLSLSSLAASWAGSDASSGIAEYRYRIGSSPGLGDILTETSAGTATSAYATGLAMTAGSTVYVSVRARDNAGNWSGLVSSSAIRVLSGEEAPNFDAGGVSGSGWRTSLHYRVVDSLGQFLTGVSSTPAVTVEGGFWHSDAAPVTMANVVAALRISGGIAAAGPGAGRYDVGTAARLARQAAGLDPLP